MKEPLDEDLAKELWTVLAYCEQDFKDTLPTDFIANLTSLAAESEKEFFIDKDKRLCEQNLSEECKDWISLLYYQSLEPNLQEEMLNVWSQE